MSIAIDLCSKVALISGASRGIGGQIARRFHAAGAAVVVNHPDFGATRGDAERLVGELNAQRAASADVFAADVANAEAVQAMIQHLRQTRGGLDFLINNADIIRDCTIVKMSIEAWNSALDVNFSGVFHCCKSGLEIMREGGAVVNLGSIAAIQGFFGQANYAAAEAGVQAMMRVLSREAARRGTRANAIAPGVGDTAMAATIPERVRAEMLKNIPMARFGTKEEIANVALFLCSPLSSYISDPTIEVNGGWRG